MGEIIRKTGGDAILTLFASIFLRTPADFVLYFPIFSQMRKKLKWILWVNEITSKVTVTKSIFGRKIKHLKQIIITNSAKQKFGGHM